MSLAPYRLEHRWKELLAAQFWSNLITKKVSAAGSVPDAVLKKAGLPERPRAARREKNRISAHFKQIERGFLLREARLMNALMACLNTCTVCCSFTATR